LEFHKQKRFTIALVAQREGAAATAQHTVAEVRRGCLSKQIQATL
jgi:hypothetical protein